MRKFTFLILVTTLATTAAFAAKRPYYGSTAPKSYQAPSNPTKPKATEAEKKAAQENELDIRKMTQRLQNGAKK